MEPFWIKVNNWDRHNPRKDIKKPTWFAMENRMVEDEDLFDLTHGEFKAWVYLLSKASQKTSAVIRVSPEHASRVCKITPEELQGAIKKLSSEDLQLVSTEVSTEDIQAAVNARVRDPNADVQNAYATGQDRQDRTDSSREKSPAAVFEINEKLSGDSVMDQVLRFVPAEIQAVWISEFHDVPWIRRTIKKTVMKKMGLKRPPKSEEWAGIITSWLCSEKERPAIPKETQEWTPDSKPLSKEEAVAVFEKHFKQLGVKQSLTEFLDKKKSA